ncbi:hypothetical protein GCM10027567_18190 [Spongiibacter taiwanensis]
MGKGLPHERSECFWYGDAPGKDSPSQPDPLTRDGGGAGQALQTSHGLTRAC